MKTMNKIYRTLLVAVAAVTGVTSANAQAWSINFDGKTSDNNDIELTVSEKVVTIGQYDFGTASWGTLVENTVFTGPTDPNYAANDISLATLTAAGAEAGKKLVIYATITNSSSYELSIQANWDSNNSLEFDDWQGDSNGRVINNNHTNAYDGRCFKMTIGENTLGKLNEWTPLKVISRGVNISSITIASGDGGSLDPKFVLQTGTRWLLRPESKGNGLYSFNGGNRSFGIRDCKAGQVITINASAEMKPTTNVQLKSQDGTTYKYVVQADGNVGFRPDRYVTIHSISIADGYSVTYKIGDDVHKVDWYEAGETITPEANPEREGYTFSGWNGYPNNMVMPAYNVSVNGSFSVNHNNIMYKVDGNDYQGYYYVAYGTTLSPDYVPATNPTKEGYLFDHWDNLPETMPDSYLVVEAVFIPDPNYGAQEYTLTLTVDGQTYQTYTLEEGANLPQVQSPSKTGYTFTGWNPQLPATMPGENLTATAQFSINSYTLTFRINGEDRDVSYTVEYGAGITLPDAPTKDGYTFSGWQNVHTTMPAQDLVIYGYFVKDKAYTTISVGTTGYSTFCSTQALYFTGTEAIKAYIAKEKSATEVSLIQVIGAVAAGTGLVLKGAAGATASIETVETGNRYDDNLLKGVLGYNVSINSAYQYVLVNKNGTAKFADTAGNQAIVPIGKAYLEGPSSAGGRMLSLVFDDETTAISTPATQAKQNDTIYNMNGMRVQNPQRGLYIMNGKKVMIK